jgi:hypothetical protein
MIDWLDRVYLTRVHLRRVHSNEVQSFASRIGRHEHFGSRSCLLHDCMNDDLNASMSTAWQWRESTNSCSVSLDQESVVVSNRGEW